MGLPSFRLNVVKVLRYQRKTRGLGLAERFSNKSVRFNDPALLYAAKCCCLISHSAIPAAMSAEYKAM